jgi:hypothetical protein
MEALRPKASPINIWRPDPRPLRFDLVHKSMIAKLRGSPVLRLAILKNWTKISGIHTRTARTDRQPQ